jgi:hypothetical protein
MASPMNYKGDPGWIPGASSKRAGSVTEQRGSVRSCESGFDSRPALQVFDCKPYRIPGFGASLRN